MILISEEANITGNRRMVHVTKPYVDDCPQFCVYFVNETNCKQNLFVC